MAQAPVSEPTAAHRPPPPGRFAVRWLLASLVFSGLIGVWSLSQPPYGGSDEMAQVIKATGTVRGQLIGQPDPGKVPAFRVFEVPKVFSEVARPCFNRGQPAGCQKFKEHDGTLVKASSYVGRYPPFYYAIVGLPSLFDYSQRGIYEMRLVSALISGLMLGAGFALASMYGKRLLRAGMLICVTPQVIYFASMINPNGLEMSSAATAWVSWLILMRDADQRPARAVVVVATISTAVFLFCRPLSVLWVGLMLITVVCSVAGGLRKVLRWTSTKIAIGVLALVGLASGAWVLLAQSYKVTPARHERMLPKGTGFSGYLNFSLHSFLGPKGYLVQFIGVFGWSWHPVRPLTLFCWAAALGLVLIPALVLGSTRHRVGMIWIVLVTFVASNAIPLSQSHSLGLVWHGRYVLPFLIGLPLLAALSLEDRIGWLAPQLSVPIAALTTAGVITGWYRCIYPYVVGRHYKGSIFDQVPGRWTPPIPLWMLMVLLAVFMLLVAGAALVQPRPSRGAHAARLSQ